MDRPTRHLRRAPAYAVVLAVLAAIGPGVGSGASSGTVVGATVPSATRLVTTNCATGMADRTELGTVLPGSNGIGMTGCAIEFGSSNDVGRLRLRQPDGYGSAMYRAALGSLDTTFGTGGHQSTSVTAGGEWYVDAVRLPDGGGFLLLGQSDNANDDIFVEKRDNDWNLVGGYGVGGRRTINYANPDTAGRIAIDSSGRAVVFAKAGTWGLVAHRLTTTGALDGTFGTGGTADPGYTSQSPASGTVLSDGRVAMAASDDNGPNRDAAIAVLTSAGQPDLTAGGGDSLSPLIDIGWHDDAVDLVPAPGGGAYMLVSNQTNSGDVAVVKFNNDASLVTSWGTNGVSQLGIGACCAHIPTDLEVDAAGRLYVAGYVNGGGNEAWVLRYTAAGAKDGSFGTGGVREWSPSVWNQDNRILLADDGTVVVGVGQNSDTSDPLDDGGRIYRLSATNGAPDATFTDGSGTGRVHLHPAAATMSSVYLPVQGPDGVLYGLGLAKQGTDVQLLASKLEARSIPQYSTGSDQDFDSTANAAFGACLVSISSGAATAPSSAFGAAGCEADDNNNWQPIAADSTGPTHQVATATANVDTAIATLRFGMHTIGSTPPGRWVAPVTIEVIAP